MKKVRLSFAALALMIGIAAAFATTPPSSRGHFTDPNWQSTDASGNVISTTMGGVYDPDKTVGVAQSDYVCSGSTVPCAVTVTGRNGSKTPNPTFIYQND
jgi:hypothetical protein